MSVHNVLKRNYSDFSELPSFEEARDIPLPDLAEMMAEAAEPSTKRVRLSDEPAPQGIWLLYHATPEQKENQEFLLSCIESQASSFLYASPNLQSNIGFIKAAIKKNPMTVLFLQARGIWTQARALWTVEQNGLALEYLPFEYRDNDYIVSKAVGNDRKAFEHASDRLKGSRAFCGGWIGSDEVMRFAKDELKDDPDFFFVPIHLNGFAIRHASPRLRSDPVFIARILRLNGDAIRYVDEVFAKQRAHVMTAVSDRGSAYQWVRPEFKGDRGVAMAAVAQDGWALEHAPTEFQNDPEFALTAISEKAGPYEFISDALKRNRPFCLEMIRRNPEVLFFLRDEYKFNRAFVLDAMSINGLALQHTTQRFTDDDQIALFAVIQNSEAYAHVSGRLLKDLLIITTALRENGEARAHIPAEMLRHPVVVAALARHDSPETYLRQWTEGINPPIDFTPLTQCDTGRSGQLRKYLNKLKLTDDYKDLHDSQKKAKKSLISRVQNMLRLACTNEPFREQMYGLMQEGSTDCEDKTILFFNDIDVQTRIFGKEHTEEELIDLAVAVQRYHLLKAHALNQAKIRGFGEEVETILYYLIKLTDALALPIQTKGMLYPDMSGVTQIMLSNAQIEIEVIFKLDLLSQSELWRAHLRKTNAADFEQIEDESVEQIEAASSQRDQDYRNATANIEVARETKLIELTKRLSLRIVDVGDQYG